MSVADAAQPTTAEPAPPPARPVAPPPSWAQVPQSSPPPLPVSAVQHPAPVAPWNLPAPRQDGLGRDTGRLLAVAFGLAWLLCPLVEPLPEHDMAYPLWQLPIDLAALATIVVAVSALWRGNRNSARLGMVAGVLMAVETVTCTIAGHTPVGWWTWVQTGLSLAVMATSAVLHRYRRP